MKINKTGILYFHLGWTDIVNQLSLISYFSERYENIILIMRPDAHQLIDFYVRNINNVKVNYERFNGINHCYFDNSILNNQNHDLLFHGVHSSLNINFNKTCDDEKVSFFVNRFYECHGLEYSIRVNYFNLDRDVYSEELTYKNFINRNGDDYILYHSDINRKLFIDNSNIKNKLPLVNLDNTTNVFFDYIKILQNAKEIHLIDSVWGAVVYQLDAKYNLFKDIPIYMNSIRGYEQMFTEPIKLNNWIFV